MYKMILKMLMFYNKKIECFTQPIFDDHDPKDTGVQLMRSLQLEKDVSKVVSYKNLKLFFMGTFDDQTGKFVLVEKPELVCDCSKVVEAREDYVPSQEINRN